MRTLNELTRRTGELEEQRSTSSGVSWQAWAIWLSRTPANEQSDEVRKMLKMGGRFTDAEIEPGIDYILAGVAGYHGID